MSPYYADGHMVGAIANITHFPYSRSYGVVSVDTIAAITSNSIKLTTQFLRLLVIIYN